MFSVIYCVCNRGFDFIGNDCICIQIITVTSWRFKPPVTRLFVYKRFGITSKTTPQLPTTGSFMRRIYQWLPSHDDVIKWKHFPRYWPFVRGIHRSPVNSPHKRPVTRSFAVFFDLRMNKRLSKQSWGWWFETLSRPLWRHRNDKRPIIRKAFPCHGITMCMYCCCNMCCRCTAGAIGNIINDVSDNVAVGHQFAIIMLFVMSA